jgi:hypothetical protein
MRIWLCHCQHGLYHALTAASVLLLVPPLVMPAKAMTKDHDAGNKHAELRGLHSDNRKTAAFSSVPC